MSSRREIAARSPLRDFSIAFLDKISAMHGSWLLRIAALLLAAASTEALALASSASPLRASRAAATPARAAPAMQFGKRNAATPEEKLEAKGYWPGEWVCADCGYIYEPGTEPPFEELRPFWKCPQCAGPRRRFAKKAGGMVAGLDDTPIQIFTYL